MAEEERRYVAGSEMASVQYYTIMISFKVSNFEIFRWRVLNFLHIAVRKFESNRSQRFADVIDQAVSCLGIAQCRQSDRQSSVELLLALSPKSLSFIQQSAVIPGSQGKVQTWSQS